MPDQLTGEVTELLQQLIRNECVNDGSVASGHEDRSADVLTHVLDGPGLDLQRYEPEPGRTSLVARIEGSDPEAPSLLLMGHTDVVPVSPERWRHDPFGGELIDGEVWGRGAVDMLNLTASMAVATRRLADEGFRPKGTLIYLAVADEEALGSHGAAWLTEHAPEAVGADYVLTESGGMPTVTPGGLKLPLIVAEKGSFWCTLRVTGTPGHGSQSYKVDNALVKAAEIVRRVSSFRPETRIHETWKGFLEGIGFPEEMTGPLLDPERFLEALEDYPDAMARLFHACTHTSVNPTIIRGGTKLNVVPDAVEIDLDIRIVPTETEEDVRRMLDEAIGDMADSVELIGPLRRAAQLLTHRHAALREPPAPRAPVVRGIVGGAHAHRRRHRRPLLPLAGHDRLRLRPLQPEDDLRGLLRHVPRRRRTRRPGIPEVVHRALASRRPRPPRLTPELAVEFRRSNDGINRQNRTVWFWRSVPSLQRRNQAPERMMRRRRSVSSRSWKTSWSVKERTR